jgi:hypothetical protein
MSAADDDTARLPASMPNPSERSSSFVRIAVALAVFATMIVGSWVYGRLSTAPARAEADQVRVRMLLLESRTQVLDAQLSLYAANFGNAAQHLEYAKPPLTAAATELTRLDHDDLAQKANAALQQVETGRALAAKLSLDANSRAGEASKLLGEVLSALPR